VLLHFSLELTFREISEQTGVSLLNGTRCALSEAGGDRSMNCRKVQELLAQYSLGELDPAAHRQVQGHLEACPNCAQEAEAMKQDVKRISTVFKGQYPWPGRRRIWSGVGALAACGLILFAAMGPIPSPPVVEAMALTGAPLDSPVMTGPEDKVVAMLSRQTGVELATTYDGDFMGGACIHLNGKSTSVLLYNIDGAEVSFFQLDASALRTSGMRQVEKEGRRFFLCSHQGCAMVAFSVGAKGFVLSGPLSEKRLISVAQGVVVLEKL
jgi:anti-sigma factor RsiW